MADFTLSTNMNLLVPTVGVDPGPDWANNLNSSLTILDGHDHSSGKGVQVTPAGININSDFSINNNNIVSPRSIRLFPNTSPLALPADVGVLYESGVDLYYNDGNGNQIRLTLGGSVAGTSGSISNLVSPATAAFLIGTGTFQFESDTNIAGNIDGAFITIRNQTLNSPGVTLTPIVSLATDYTLVLPTLPVTQSFMTLDQSGNMSAPWTVDNTTLAISGSNVIVKPQGITPTQLLTRALISTPASVGGIAYSQSSGVFGASTTTPTLVTNQSVVLTTRGGPVQISFQPSNIVDSGATQSNIFAVNGIAQIIRDGSVVVAEFLLAPGTSRANLPGSLNIIDVPSAGTHSYGLYAFVYSPGVGVFVQVTNIMTLAYEIM